MKRILIFTAGFGEGHNSAATNIRKALEHLAEDETEVEIFDLFDTCYGVFNELIRQAYLTAINYTPRLWRGLYSLTDHTGLLPGNVVALTRMQKAMEDLLLQVEPDVVVSTYPIYDYLIDEIHKEGRPRHFSQITVVTDSISVNAMWYRCHSDYFIVPNDETAAVLQKEGVPPEKIKPLGFPVALEFAKPDLVPAPPDPAQGHPPHILYMANARKKKATRLLELLLLKHEDWHVTIGTGRDEKLRQAALEIARPAGERARVQGWTTHMPQLLLSHHLLITKAGGATVQEAIAARCPLIINHIIPGQEEGNAEFIRRANIGAVAEKPKEIVNWIERAFADQAQLWSLWKRNIAALGRPDSSLQIARFILDEAVPTNVPPPPVLHRAEARPPSSAPASASPAKKLLLCDFHTHTTFSDGKLTVAELVDFYGQRSFDCLCITDHICDPQRLLGRISNLSGLVIGPGEADEYFSVIEGEKKRAWKKYELLLLAGLEFNKDGYTARTSAHLLGLDLRAPVDPTLQIKEIIAAIHAQGGLAVASHPHETRSIWGKDTLFLWENQDEYAPLLDAWEIANRDDIFNPVGLKRLPFIASSDFHKPKHIHSWKTMLYCDKDPEAIKDCIRRNQDIAITLYRDHRFGLNSPAAHTGNFSIPAAS